MSIASSHDGTNDQISLEGQQRENQSEAGLLRDVYGSDIPARLIQECVFR